MRRLDGKPKNYAFRDLIGSKFGSLTPISSFINEEHKPNRRRYWVCQCDCGNEHTVEAFNLSSGHTLSCGCRKPVYTEESAKHKREVMSRPGAAFRQCLLGYKHGAKARNLAWELTDEQFRALTTSPCHYTGLLPFTVWEADSGEQYIYNGIDRVDNTKGYLWENCVPCCAEINMMKKALTKERFIELCKAVAERF